MRTGSASAAEPVESKRKTEAKASRSTAAAPSPKSDKLSYKDQRDYDLLPERIEELETAIQRGEAILADPDLYTSDPKKFATISKGLENARAEKDAAEERWLELAELAEG